MRRIGSLLFFLLILAVAIAPSAWRYWNFYGRAPWQSSVQSLPAPAYSGEEVPNVAQPPQSPFVDEPEVNEGRVLLDVAHDNQFKMEEIGSLDGRLAARGVELVRYRSGDLARQLRGVSAFVVIAPVETFGDDEITAVVDFVERGGRLLMVGDPTRFTIDFEEDDFGFVVDFSFNRNDLPLNRLANEFDLIFEGDYLYNLADNEGNFRNIIIASDHIGESSLTEDLEMVALYGSHSIRTGNHSEPLLSGGAETYSSATDRAGGLHLAAVSEDERVLALGDLNFMAEPYFSSFDNMQFIANIADFLVGDSRDYVLSDFPYFYQSETIDLLYVGEVDLGVDAFDDIITLQDTFREAGQSLTLAAEPQEGHDALVIGLYNDAIRNEAVRTILADAGLRLVIDPPVLTEEELEAQEEKEEENETSDEEVEMPAADGEEGDEDMDEEGAEEEDEPELTYQIQTEMGNIQMLGTSLIYLHKTEAGREVIVLAASQAGLDNMLERVRSLVPLDSDYALEDCLLTSAMALCPSEVDDETLEAELETGSEPVFVSSDDDEEDAGNTAVDDVDDDNEEDEGDEDSVSDNDENETGEESEPFTIENLDPFPTEQGEIALDETVEATLPEGERHSWVYSGEVVTATIVVSASDEIDSILEVYDAEGVFVVYIDDNFSGNVEQATGFPLENGYIIVVSDYFNVGGDYILSVTESSEEAEDTSEEDGDESEPTNAFPVLDELDPAPVLQGELAADETVTAVLLEQESHLWTYTGEDGEVTITLESDPDTDSGFIIYNADGEYLTHVDNAFSGDTESTEWNLEPDYGIVIYEYAEASGSYTLTLSAADTLVLPVDDNEDEEEAEEESIDEPTDEEDGAEDDVEDAEDAEVDEDVATADSESINTIFIYVDNDGEYLGTDTSNIVDVAALLADSDYEVTVWDADEQDALTEADLEGHDLVLWYSGMYREEQAEDPDMLILFSYAVLGGGNLLTIGATPPIFEPADVSEIVDVEILADAEIFTAGLPEGDVLTLEGTFSTAVTSQTLDDDPEEDEVRFMARGPESEDSGDLMGISATSPDTGTQIAILLLPLEAFDTDTQTILLNNLINWFD